MKHRRTSLKFKSLVVTGCMLLGASVTAVSQTQLEIENDGLTLSAFASSEKNVLSTSIRIVGPDGFVFEDRIEDSAVRWIPEGELADGEYRWEAWTVTVEPGAPARTITTPKASMPTSLDGQETQMKARIESDSLSHEVPIERTFDSSYKRVHRKSGSFRVQDGLLLPISDREDSVSQNKPNILERAFGAILDFAFPSAHAQQVFTTDLEIEKVSPGLNLDNTGTGANLWRIWVGAASGDLYFRDDTNSFTTPLRIEQGAPADSIRVSQFGNIGIGTASPSYALHIADVAPRIRLEDTDDIQSWYVKNSNAGNFEIGEGAGGSGAFVINPNAIQGALTVGEFGVGVGSLAALADFTVGDISAGGRIQILGGSNWHVLTDINGFGIQDFGLFGSTTPLRIDNGAPTNSLRIAADGSVGIGTASPAVALHVSRSDNTAAVHVTDTGALDGQTMFNLVNNGHPKFRLQDSSQADVRWEFRTFGSGASEGFTINKIGSGKLEMDLQAGGDVTFGGTVSGGSSREIKHGIENIDPTTLLDKLNNLSIYEWSYDAAPDQRRIGPMAEDFYQQFQLGSSDKHIAPSDMAGIALAAVKSLKQENSELKDRLKRLEDLLGSEG